MPPRGGGSFPNLEAIHSAQAKSSPPFGSGALPQNAVNARGLFPLVGGHPFHSQQLGVERAGQQILEGSHPVPSLLLHSLCDTHLQPSDLTPCMFPVYGFPFLCVVDECTSSHGRLLLSHLSKVLQVLSQ